MQVRTKETLEKINGKIIVQTEKLNSIEISKKNLLDNYEQHEIKKNNLKTMLKNLQEDTFKAKQVMLLQENTIDKILGGLEDQQQIVEDKLNELDNKIVKHTTDTRRYQDRLLKEIKNNEEKKLNMTEKENYIVKLILGIDLIKK